jgi:hypothetical protein
MTSKAKNLIKTLTALKASIENSFNTHQATRLIEFAHELSRCRSAEKSIKDFWLMQANAAAYKLSSQ